MSCQKAFPKICGYYLPASITALGASTSFWSFRPKFFIKIGKDIFFPFVYCTIFRQYTTIYQYSDMMIYTQVTSWQHVPTVNDHLQANREHFKFLLYLKNVLYWPEDGPLRSKHVATI